MSLANDLASELAYPVVPLFLTVTLGASVSVLGVIEGVAEGLAVGLKGISGWLSDRAAHRRLPWIFGGYAASALARPLLAAANGFGLVLSARVVDRLGKASRTAPRDALIRDSTPAALRGAAFGYHRALDTTGAVIGPLVAVGLLAAGVSLRGALWVAVAPGFATLLLLRRAREAPQAEEHAAAPTARASLPPRFFVVLAIWTLFSLGNSSDAFLLLRSHALGLDATLTVLAYALYNLVYAGLAWPLGALSDRVPRTVVLAAGLAVFGLVYLGFAEASSSWQVWPLFAVYGAYVAATDGVARAWVSDQVPAAASGTAFGLFAAATGGALLAASVVAGQLWSHVGRDAPFLMGAASAAAALVVLGVVEVRRRRSPASRSCRGREG